MSALFALAAVIAMLASVVVCGAGGDMMRSDDPAWMKVLLIGAVIGIAALALAYCSGRLA